MRISIITLCWLTLYFAIALAALRHPTPALSGTINLLWQLSVASALILAFHLRSTVLCSFVVFNLLAAFNYTYISMLTIPVMIELGVTTGAVEYSNVQSMLHCHFAFIFGMVGLAFGKLVTISFDRARPS